MYQLEDYSEALLHQKPGWLHQNRYQDQEPRGNYEVVRPPLEQSHPQSSSTKATDHLGRDRYYHRHRHHRYLAIRFRLREKHLSYRQRCHHRHHCRKRYLNYRRQYLAGPY